MWRNRVGGTEVILIATIRRDKYISERLTKKLVPFIPGVVE